MKKILKFCTFLTVVIAINSNVYANEMSDWAVTKVNEAIGEGIVPANLQGDYLNATTRLQFTELATALYEKVMGVTIEGRSTFLDTDNINVEKMAFLGVVTGVGDGLFAPNEKLTREEAAVMIARLSESMKYSLEKIPPLFADNGYISSWAYEAIGQVQAYEIMSGVGENEFAPKNDYTIEQSIVTLMRLYDLIR